MEEEDELDDRRCTTGSTDAETALDVKSMLEQASPKALAPYLDLSAVF